MDDLEALQNDVTQLKRSVFGFIDPDSNAFVPGVMQLAADTAKELKQIKWVLIAGVLLAVGSRPDLWAIIERVIK